MECAALCMLAATVGFVPSPDTHRCSYCVEARSTYPDCFEDVIECAYRDPSSLIFCLNVYEHAAASMVHYSARCLSYEKFYVSDDAIRKIGTSGMCKFSDVQPCECDVCRTQTTTTELGITLMSSSDHTRKHKHHHHHHHHHTNLTRSHPSAPRLLQNISNPQQSAYKEDGLRFAAHSSSSRRSLLSILLISTITILLKQSC
ncbi:unnamed protein product [Cylicocyclus nassatus]|uniref:Uncharacterized protein n=1 Tax=Cylicocyclus nassatus TaxID=53992 RepID=A0AA36HDS5_CYLNA|nr:unnamed protein product [Cylicocyclus nassatus]